MRLYLFSSKYPTDNLLYHFENAYFDWKQKHAVFAHASLNANELLLTTPFSRIGPCLYSSYLRYFAKKHLFGFYLVFFDVLLHLNGQIHTIFFTKTVGYFCEGKQLGKKYLVYI